MAGRKGRQAKSGVALPPFPAGWTMVVHVTGCKKIAFYLATRPISGRTELVSEQARYPDGLPVEPGVAICGSCKTPIELKELAVPPARWKLGDPINVRSKR